MAKKKAEVRSHSDGAGIPALSGLARAIARVAAKDVVISEATDPSHTTELTSDDVALLTVREAASRLGTSDDVVRTLLRNKKITAIKVGGAWRIPQTALTDFLISRLERP